MSDNENPPATPPDSNSNTSNPPAKRSKRTRALLACQRCKHRKQRCDGGDPSCSTCRRLKLDCIYVMPTHPKPGQAKVYIKALEERVAELEMSLNNHGNIAAALDHWGQRDATNRRQSDVGVETNSLLTAVRDLSLEVTGGYVGSTSNITLGRILGTVAASKLQLEGVSPEGWDEVQRRNTISICSEADFSSPGRELYHFETPAHVADLMLNAYLKHLSPLLPIIHSPKIRELHQRRGSLVDPYEESVLHLIYALGGHFMETVGEHCATHDYTRHYEAALAHRETILQYGDMRTLTYLLLLAQHSLRVPKDSGAWTFTRLAMSLCVELGLHRKRRDQRPNLKSELEKRIFWSCYYLDRDLSLALGRPPSISDHDIDVQPPLDVDETNEDPVVFLKASEHDPTYPANPITTLTYFVYLNRLRRIESAIQHSIYRVDDDLTGNNKDVTETTEKYLEVLFQWKERIPVHTQQWEGNRAHNNPYIGNDSYMVLYYKCLRLLLQPQLYAHPINPRYLQLCTDACTGICETYKRLHHSTPIGFTTISLQAVFLAGLTLVYCLWSLASTTLRTTRALTDCSIMLYVMTERWPSARKYRNMFEGIKDLVLDLIANGECKAREAVGQEAISESVRETLQGGLDVEMVAESSRADLEQMIGDITGEGMFMWSGLGEDGGELGEGFGDDFGIGEVDAFNGLI